MELWLILGRKMLILGDATQIQEHTNKVKEVYYIFQINGLLPECSVTMIKMDSLELSLKTQKDTLLKKIT